MSKSGFHPDVKRLLDGELGLDDLPAALRAEGEEALRMVAAVDQTEPAMSAGFEGRVMAAIHDRGKRPREIVVRLRPWMLAPALAAAAVLVFLLIRPALSPESPAGLVTVRFVLAAPEASRVSVAGTFNQWDAAATPLVRSDDAGVWSATLSLPAGEHQYAFVVDGQRWVPDPAAPAVDDGFGGGRRNSVLTL